MTTRARPAGAAGPSGRAVRRVLSVGGTVFLLLVVAGVLFRVFGIERRFLYHPDRLVARTPRDVGLAYDDATFPAADGTRLHGWWVPAEGARLTVVWCHGNAGNISGRVGNLALLHRRLGVNVLLFDYRGYGRSDGTLSDLDERATSADVEGARAFARSRPDARGTRLVLFGRSLGAAVALAEAVRDPPDGLVLESPFTSVAAMARGILPLVPWGLVLSSRYDSLRRVGALRAPLLLVHGDRDEVVPFEMGRRLFDAAPEPKTFLRVAGGGHDDLAEVGGEAYVEAWTRFLEAIGP